MNTPRGKRAAAMLVLAGLLLTLATGCKPVASVPRVATFVGTVENSDAFIALTRVGEDVLAYVCDSGSTSAWFKGKAAGSTFDLASGEALLRATLSDGRLEGTFTSSYGGAHAFSARAAADGAGFYHAVQTVAGVAYVGSWILLRDGQQRGAVEAGGALLLGPQPVLDPERRTVVLPGGGTLAVRSASDFLSSFAGTAAAE